MRLKCSFCGRDQHQVKTLFKGLTNKEIANALELKVDQELEQMLGELENKDEPKQGSLL